MKLTKKLETEILEAYNKTVDANLRGDMRTFASMLDENCHIFGTAASEAFKNKKTAIKFYSATAGQITGRVEFRNRKINVMTIDKEVMVNERLDFYVLIDDQWTLYGPTRVSCLFHKKNNQWKVIHMHGSFSDSKTEEGEQVNSNKIKAENIQLRDAVKRRTIELEEKNRELEIETALEKVRAIALSMKEPADMLAVCKTISLQLQSLGVKEIRNVQTAIFYESRGIYMNYEFYAKYNKTFITETSYTNHKIDKAFAAKMLKGKGEVYITHINGKKVKDWLAYQKTTNVFIDRFLEKASSLNYYWHSLGPVALGFSSYVSLSKDVLNLFGRFLKVFELAYRRYLDIEKAEAQAREARIETALERVRAVAMAMHKPGDLSAISKTIFTELKSLGYVHLRNTEIVINHHENKSVSSYHFSDYGNYEVIEIDYTTNPIIQKWVKDLNKADNAFVPVSIPEKQMKDWNKYRKELGYKHDPGMSRAKTVYYYSYSIGFGALSVSSWQSISDEQIEILERFRNVFNLSYKRYADITLAEAQAREAEIELALERVRARSLALQHTSELQEVVNIVAQQLLNINIDIYGGVFICINDEVDNDLPLWSSAGVTEYVQKVIGPFLNKPIFNNLVARIKKKNNFLVEEYSKEDKDEFFNHLFKYEPWKSTSATRKKELMAMAGGYTRSVVVSHHTTIAITNHNGKKFSDKDNKILKRFGKVFEQTYTRFLDLQKAEAQSREAEIELALERVRARTMAMQHSDELQEASFLLDEQVRALGIKTWGCAFNIYREKDSIEWFGNEKGVLPTYTVPRKGMFKKYYELGQKGNTIHVQEITGKKCIAHYEYMSTLPVIGDVLKQLKKDQRVFS